MSLACVVNCIKFKNGQRHKDVNSIKKMMEVRQKRNRERERERERERGEGEGERERVRVRVEGQKTARKRNKETKLLNIIIKKILN